MTIGELNAFINVLDFQGVKMEEIKKILFDAGLFIAILLLAFLMHSQSVVDFLLN